MRDGGGTLILVAGPSGAGKDTLIAAAQERFRCDPRIRFPARAITRGAQIGEPHIAVSEQEFARLEAGGGFVLAWRAHGLAYGIPAGVFDMLRVGITVVVNVSRGIISEARTKWPKTRVLLVTADAGALRERILARGRETASDVDGRLQRAVEERMRVPEAEWVSEIDNSGDLAAAAEHFIALIDGCL